MFKTIRIKIIIMLFSVFIAFLLFHSTYQFKMIKEDTFQTLHSVNKTINTLLVEYISAYIYNKDKQNLQLSIDAIDSKYIKAIYILDQEGFIIAQDHTTDVKHIEHPWFKRLLTSKDTSIKNTDEYLVLSTFSILDVPIGYMIMEADLDTFHQHITAEREEIFVSAGILAMIFLGISLVIANSFSTPIENIVKKLHEVKENEILAFKEQDQEEFSYLCKNISWAHNRLIHVNENLEDEVNKKTQELQELNKTLEEKVAIAVKEVADKSKMLEQQSRLAQMGEMISMIAHQWRQPLAAISAVSINMRLALSLNRYDLSKQEEYEKFEKEYSESLDNIDNFVQNLTRTIDDFRNFFKSNKERVITDINDPVKKALHILETSIRNSGVEMKIDFKSVKKLPMLDSEIMQVILNILKNSQDNFMEKEMKGGKIFISSYDTDYGLALEIEDNGGGVPEDILPDIFNPYFSTKNEKNGTGLGLYMSKTIVEEHHHGWLETINQNNGVCFKIQLISDENNRT